MATYKENIKRIIKRLERMEKAIPTDRYSEDFTTAIEALKGIINKSEAEPRTNVEYEQWKRDHRVL